MLRSVSTRNQHWLLIYIANCFFFTRSHWQLEVFGKNAFFVDIFGIFSLDMSYISQNLLKKVHHESLPFFSLSLLFMRFCLGMHTNHNFRRVSDLVFPFLAFFSFPYLLWPLLTFYWACFQFINSPESTTETGYSQSGWGKCSWGKFSFEFFCSNL